MMHVMQIISHLRESDLKKLALSKNIPGAVQTAEQLEQHLFHNPHFSPDAVFVLRNKSDGPPLAVGIVVASESRHSTAPK